MGVSKGKAPAGCRGLSYSRTIREQQRQLPPPIPQQPPRVGAGRLAVLERALPVHRRIAVAFGLLDATPLAAGQILGRLSPPVQRGGMGLSRLLRVRSVPRIH